METKIIVALVASATSIVVAIISLISNYSTNKKLIKANKSIELYKLEIEKKRSKFQIYDKQLKDNFETLGQYIKQLQSLKDFLFFITNSTENSLDSETAINEVVKLRKELFLCYEEKSHYLNDEVLKSAHSIKNYALKIENEIKVLFKNREYVTLLEQDLILIQGERDVLTDFQNIFRDKRMKILYDVS